MEEKKDLSVINCIATSLLAIFLSVPSDRWFLWCRRLGKCFLPNCRCSWCYHGSADRPLRSRQCWNRMALFYAELSVLLLY